MNTVFMGPAAGTAIGRPLRRTLVRHRYGQLQATHPKAVFPAATNFIMHRAFVHYRVTA